MGIGEREKAVNKLSRTITTMERLANRIGHTKLEYEMHGLAKVMTHDTKLLKRPFEGLLEIVSIGLLSRLNGDRS